jgi:hypothetical protein
MGLLTNLSVGLSFTQLTNGGLGSLLGKLAQVIGVSLPATQGTNINANIKYIYELTDQLGNCVLPLAI